MCYICRMQWIKNISVIFFMMIFLMSSAGIVVFQTHCSCTGNEQVSLYFSPETCEDNFHRHHSHNTSGEEISTDIHECHECSKHVHDCGCSTPNVKYFKLKNQLTDEEVKYVKIQSVDILFFCEPVLDFTADSEPGETQHFYIDPPPVTGSSFDFLISIQQLKIPEIA